MNRELFFCEGCAYRFSGASSISVFCSKDCAKTYGKLSSKEMEKVLLKNRVKRVEDKVDILLSFEKKLDLILKKLESIEERLSYLEDE